MTYTNIASAYTTAHNPNAVNLFNKNSWTRFKADNPGMSKTQFKVAIQQLQQAGVFKDSPKGITNQALKEEVLYGTPGIDSPDNPMGKYQGPQGNFGLNSYNAAKADNHTPQEIFAGVPKGGMFMPSGAKAQYMEDITPPLPEMPEMPDIQFPGTQTGASNVSNYSALGIRSPRPEGWDLNTGGTTAAFGRKPKRLKNIANALAIINPVTL